MIYPIPQKRPIVKTRPLLFLIQCKRSIRKPKYTFKKASIYIQTWTRAGKQPWALGWQENRPKVRLKVLGMCAFLFLKFAWTLFWQPRRRMKGNRHPEVKWNGSATPLNHSHAPCRAIPPVFACSSFNIFRTMKARKGEQTRFKRNVQLKEPPSSPLVGLLN